MLLKSHMNVYQSLKSRAFPKNNQLMIHFPNPANRNKWSTQWDLIEMHNCIVIHTRFLANAALHTCASPVIYTDKHTLCINTVHTQIYRPNQLIDRKRHRHRNSHINSDAETCCTYKVLQYTHIDEQTTGWQAHTRTRKHKHTHTHTHSIPRPLHVSVNPSRQSVLRGLDAAVWL